MLELARRRRGTHSERSCARTNRFKPSLPISIPLPRSHMNPPRSSPVALKPQADLIFDLSPEAPTGAESHPMKRYAEHHDPVYEISSAASAFHGTEPLTTTSRPGRTMAISRADEGPPHATILASDSNNANIEQDKQDLFSYPFPTLDPCYTRSSDININLRSHKRDTSQTSDDLFLPSQIQPVKPLKNTSPSRRGQDYQRSLSVPSTSIEKASSTLSSRSSSHSVFFSNRENGSSVLQHPIVSSSITSVFSQARSPNLEAFPSVESKRPFKFPLIDAKA